MPERLADWYDERFVDVVLGKHPAPVSPVTLKPMWEKGIRLHGAQRGLVCDPIRFKKADGGWRFGKSFGPAVAIYLDMLWRYFVRGVGNDLWGVVADSYAMATEEMRHLDRLLTEGGIEHEFHTPMNQSWRLTLPWGAEVVTLTAADVSKIASRPYRGVVIAEANQTVPDTWRAAQGRVSETRGWVIMSGTFEASKGPWYASLTKEWERGDGLGAVYVCPSWDNPLVYPGGRNDPEILAREREMPPSLFMEKFGGIPQTPSDVVFPEARFEIQVKRRYERLGTSYDPDRPVVLFGDPGLSHATAVWAAQFDWSPEAKAEMRVPESLAQRLAHNGPVEGGGNVVWLIDCIYRWGREVEQILDEVVARPWAENVQEAVLDFASRQRRTEGKPVKYQWHKFWQEKMGRALWIHANPVPLAPGYDIHKRALLNAWPREQAEAMFNPDRRLRQVVDPAGPRLYVDPDAAGPLFGGIIDGQKWDGEYLLHRNHRNRMGMVDRAEPVPLHDDAIKAINYGLFWYFGAGRTRHRRSELAQSVPWELAAVG